MSVARETEAARVGFDPIAKVRVFEDHDAAYEVWKAAGVRDRVVVHFDGHLDFDWIADRSASELLAARSSEELGQLLSEVRSWDVDGRPFRQRINIANFVYPAIKEGLVRQFIWVMPDPFWMNSRNRRLIGKGLRRKVGRRPDEAGPMQVSDGGITFAVLGCPVTACTLTSLPRIGEPVLLDIDVDYLLTRGPVGPPPYFHRTLPQPWLWPGTFVQRLRAAQLRTGLATVAYSVNGGYTPLRYKYFGDLISKALSHPLAPPSDAPPPGSAAEVFREASRALTAGNLRMARQWWRSMVRLDPSYRTAYAIPGWRDEVSGRWHSALEIYDRMTEIDPQWHVPYLGHGRVSWHFRRYADAESAFEKACALSPGPTSATHWLGLCRFRGGDWESARRIWARTVEEDSTEARSWNGLAHLEARRDDPVRALEHARRCVALGWDRPSLRWLMARMAWRSGQRRLAQHEVKIWARRGLRTAMARGLTWCRRIGRNRERGYGESHDEGGPQADARMV